MQCHANMSARRRAAQVCARRGARCSIPSVASGKAVPAEIREFQQLERSGWLGRLQQPLSRTAQQRRVSTNLAAPAIDAPDLAALSDWAAALEQLMGRMNDSLDEC